MHMEFSQILLSFGSRHQLRNSQLQQVVKQMYTLSKHNLLRDFMHMASEAILLFR